MSRSSTTEEKWWSFFSPGSARTDGGEGSTTTETRWKFFSPGSARTDALPTSRLSVQRVSIQPTVGLQARFASARGR
jgi:hypothetical protein